MNDKPFSSVTSKWRLNKPYRFQLAFFREDLPSPSAEGFVSVPPFKVVSANEPDIKNIVLFSFLNRGFLPKVKAQSEDQNFYLKLFEFPKEISPEKSSKMILDKFLLTKMQQGQELQCYIVQAENIFVKFGWIGLKLIDFVSRPFPRFLIPNDPVKAQEYFDSSLPFSSLYLLPVGDANPGLSEEKLIEHSYGGVISFREELLKIYSTYNAIETINQDNMFIVGRQHCNETMTTVRKISVITLKQIDDFKKPDENFKDFKKRLIGRPMPLNEHDFLSSLLLVDYTDYIPDKKDALEVPSTKEQLDREWRPDLDSNHVLEIASIVRLENIAENGSHSLAAKYMKVPNTLDTRGKDYKLPSFTNADQTALAGKRVLMISADGPELPEIDVPMEYLKARGADVKLAGQNWIFEYRDPPGHIVIAQWLADNICVKADLALKDVRVAEWDAIFIPGGAWNPDMLRTDADALRIVREARAHGVLIVSLCHGPQVLISAARSDPSGQVVFPLGTLITGVPSIRGDLDNAGFTVHDEEPIVYDSASRLLTARDPDDLGPLCEAMGCLLSQPMHK